MRASTAIALLPFLAVAAPTAASLVGKRADTWGGAVSLGPTKSTIVNAVTTLIPGRSPPNQTAQLFLWPGMNNGTGTEGQSDCAGTIKEQKYLNTVITLADSDPTFGDTVSSSQGAQYSELKQTEGGKVWTIDAITIPAMQ